ncbi:hypothetical protein BTO30_16560 [Domibacillus antri]|uniref:Uncharacterized protein n=1 Tax=Domibacillus antri TaxID=1714264 RepID=A0A1Q8Q1E9_9BACI|nr:hypothetical protein [Domibacillus antri]OLN21147.1 hypothetical protein BTO30_16560 [Domibacillus antri]
MMVVENLLDVKSYFAGEVKDNFVVQYEKMLKSNAFYEAGGLHETEEETAECIKVLRSTGEASSVTRISEYQIGGEFTCVDDVLARIREAHRDIFKA